MIRTRKNKNYKTITCSEGEFITSYKEGDDIRDFSASEVVYAPLKADTSIYHCISADEVARLEELAEEARNKDMVEPLNAE